MFVDLYSQKVASIESGRLFDYFYALIRDTNKKDPSEKGLNELVLIVK